MKLMLPRDFGGCGEFKWLGCIAIELSKLEAVGKAGGGFHWAAAQVQHAWSWGYCCAWDVLCFARQVGCSAHLSFCKVVVCRLDSLEEFQQHLLYHISTRFEQFDFFSLPFR